MLSDPPPVVIMMVKAELWCLIFRPTKVLYCACTSLGQVRCGSRILWSVLLRSENRSGRGSAGNCLVYGKCDGCRWDRGNHGKQLLQGVWHHIRRYVRLEPASSLSFVFCWIFIFKLHSTPDTDSDKLRCMNGLIIRITLLLLPIKVSSTSQMGRSGRWKSKKSDIYVVGWLFIRFVRSITDACNGYRTNREYWENIEKN